MMDQKTIDAYDRMAKEYDENTEAFWDLFPQTFLSDFASLTGKDIIDVGSGPGRDGLLLEKLGKEVICVDASEAMVKISEERGLTSVCADFHHLPFDKESFDGAWSYTALLHTPKKDVGTALTEIYRVVRPSGIFALGLIEGDTEGYREKSGIDMPRWFSYYQKDEVIEMCRLHGFEFLSFSTCTPGERNYLHFLFRKV